MSPESIRERCSWCGARIDDGSGWRAFEPAGERRAVFCRLEHVVPWAIEGPHWEAGALEEPSALDEGPLRCSLCGAELGEVHVVAVHHRDEHRIGDAFCSVEHLADWAKAGGRWR